MALTKVTYSMINGADVNILDFGAVGDGVTDDTAAIQAALDSLGVAGGTVVIPDGTTPLIDSNLNIPDNCALVGAKAIRGRTVGTPNMNLWKPRIILNRAATITLNNSSEISKIAIFAKNLQFSSTYAVVAAWTGTAITLADNKSDQLVEDCMILGFDTAISTVYGITRIDRPRIHRCFIDCLNGVFLENAMDVAYVSEIHGVPWVTYYSQPEPNEIHLTRPGNFICLKGGINDWAKVTNCFNYGWNVGYRVIGADAVTLLGCGADGPPGFANGSQGILIESHAIDTRIIGCQVAAKETGIYIRTIDTYNQVYIADTNVWASYSYGIRIVNGDVNVCGCGIRNTGGTATGVYFENTGTKLRLNNCKIQGFSIGIKTDSVGAVVFNTDCDFTGTTTPINNPHTKTILSADPLMLDGNNTFFIVNGMTNFGVLSNPKQYVGRLVTLKFDEPLFVGVTGNIKLAGGVAFNVSANDTLTLASDGTNWYEVARSVN